MNKSIAEQAANKPQNGFFTGPLDENKAFDLLSQLLRVADPSAVYAPPVHKGSRTVVLASEVTASLGVGYGAGEDTQGKDGGPSRGSGGGGGGFSAARPVAAVIIDDNGVTVEPVVDATKLGIAAITAMGAMFLAWTRIRRAARK